DRHRESGVDRGEEAGGKTRGDDVDLPGCGERDRVLARLHVLEVDVEALVLEVALRLGHIGRGEDGELNDTHRDFLRLTAAVACCGAAIALVFGGAPAAGGGGEGGRGGRAREPRAAGKRVLPDSSSF